MSSAVPMATGEAALILSYFTKKRFKRNDVLIHEGEVAPAIFFVENGGLHLFYNDENGNEKSCDFIFKNEFITDLLGFFEKNTCYLFYKSTGAYSLLCNYRSRFFRIVGILSFYQNLLQPNCRADSSRGNKENQIAAILLSGKNICRTTGTKAKYFSAGAAAAHSTIPGHCPRKP